MPLSDVAQVTVSTTAQPVTRVGFGTPLIADACNAWGASQDRVRTYRTVAELVTDGFVAGDAVYKAASAMLAQKNPPPTFKVGRRASKPTLHWTITPTAQDTTKYTVTVDGTDYSFTSGAGATVAQIIVGLKAAIDAGAPAGITTANIGPNTALGLTATVPGAYHFIKAMRPDILTTPNTLLDVKQDQADPGIAADLDAILAADQNWYVLLLTVNSAAELAAAAAWTETNKKLFLATSQDSICYTASGADILTALKNANDFRTAAAYYHNPAAFPAAALAGSRLSTDPGSENWAFAPVAGIEGTTFVGNQQAQLDAKNGNYIYVNAGSTYFWKGKVASGEWIDATRGTDALTVGMQEDILQMQLDKAALGQKVAYDDGGIAAFQNSVLGTLKRFERQGFLVSGSSTCTVPLAKDVSGADRQTRTLNNIVWTAQKAGAIILGKITGTLT